MKTFISKDSVTLAEEAQFIWVDSDRRKKKLAYSKLIKNLKTCQKWSGVHSLELFAANTWSFQIKALISKDSLTCAEETHFIWVDSDIRVGQYKEKFGLIVSWVKKAENLSKMVLGTLFGIFYSQYLIVPNKDTYLQGLGHHRRGGKIHRSQFGRKGPPVEVKIWPIINRAKKPEKL